MISGCLCACCGKGQGSYWKTIYHKYIQTVPILYIVNSNIWYNSMIDPTFLEQLTKIHSSVTEFTPLCNVLQHRAWGNIGIL